MTPPDFHTRRIRKKPIKKISIASSLKKPEVKHTLLTILLIVIGGFLLIRSISALNVSSIFKIISWTVGKDLEMDEKGRTNILLLGAAGPGVEGELLTDSLMLVSLNQKEEKASLFSLPRDLYVKTKKTGGHRINLLYENGGLEFTRETISKLLDTPLHYVVKVDFLGFEKMIDALGGITVNVTETINDPFYPKDGTYDFERFYIPAGVQTLDGKTALKYVRSRQTTSDFLRSKRQQQVLLAMKEKALEEGLLSSSSHLKGLYRTIREHMETDIPLREMITLAKIASRFDETKIYHFMVHDDPTVAGGFLYTPLRELYGGAFVLIPASDQWDEVQRYIRLTTEKPEWLQGNVKLQILNGTKRGGLAGSMKVILKRYGFSVPRFGNAQSQGIPKTTVFVKNPEMKEAAFFLQNLFPAEVSETPPEKYTLPPYESDADIIVEFGEDALVAFDTLDIFRNVVELKPKEPTP